MTSIVRNNLLTRPGYTPYCGNPHCRQGAVKTTFNGHQFVCQCGWQSEYEADFIEQYKQFNSGENNVADD